MKKTSPQNANKKNGLELSNKFVAQCHSELLRHIRTHLLRMWIRNLYAICNVDAEIGCKQPRAA